MSRARLTHTTRPVSMADRTAIVATVVYPELGITCTTEWQGSSTPGYPGPVLWCASDGKTWHRVDHPERFGDTFNAEWIERFYA